MIRRNHVTWGIAATLILAVGVFLNAARFLVVEAPLERADAVVVLLGGLPYRAMTAGELFREGFAPRILVSRPIPEDPRLTLFRRFGVHRVEDDQTAIRILAWYGVPTSAILVSVADGIGTRPELRSVARVVRREGLHSVILVTDPVHTRRAFLYMRAFGGDRLRVIPRASARPLPSDDWWWNTAEAEAVLHEYLGLAAFVWHRLAGKLRVDTP